MITERQDEGFSLVEVVVSMMIFALLASFVLGMVLSLTDSTRDNDRRLAAAGVVNQQIEAIRGTPVLQIPDGEVTSTVSVGNTEFTVTQTSSLVSSNTAVSLCSSQSGNLAYRRVTVSVAWPGMGTMQPARADTLKVIGTSELGSSSGTLAVSVSDAAGAPVSGIPITLSPSNRQSSTGADGCAVFLAVPEGAYIASASQSGYVGPDGGSVQQASLSARSAVVVRGSLSLARSGAQPLRPETLLGYTMLAQYPVGIRSTYLGPAALAIGCGTTNPCLTAMPGQIPSLFPTQYTYWMGPCNDSMRTGTTVTGTVTAGQTASELTVPLAKVRVNTLRNGLAVVGVSVKVSHAKETNSAAPSCPSGVSYSMSTTALTGTAILLPYGTWTFTTSKGSTTVTLAQGINTVYVNG